MDEMTDEQDDHAFSLKGRWPRLLVIGLTSVALVLLAASQSTSEGGGSLANLGPIELVSEPQSAPEAAQDRGIADNGGDEGSAKIDPLAVTKLKKDYETWFRVHSERNWFGHTTFSKDALWNKTQYLSRLDCKLAAVYGLRHISDHCHFPCEDCNTTHFRFNCSGYEEGFCKPCDSEDLSCDEGWVRMGCGFKQEGQCERCRDCPWGYFRDGCSTDQKGLCSTCSMYEEGFYNDGCLWVHEGEKRECRDCGEGSWLWGCGGLHEGQCMNCTMPGPTEYLTKACGARSNAELASCSDLLSAKPCGDHMYRAGCGGLTEGACTSCEAEACPPGEYRLGCGGLNKGECKPCDSCEEGMVRLHCSGEGPGECAACGTCAEGEWREGCVFVSEGECSECPVCESNKYSSGCGAQSQGACLDCVMCTEDEYETQVCHGTAKRTCQSCTALEACAQGSYRAMCGKGSKGQCLECPECGMNKYRQECGVMSEGVCLDCPHSCPVGEWLQGCRGMSVGKCAQCHVEDGHYSLGCNWTDPGELTECRDCGAGFWLQGCGEMRVEPGTCRPVTPPSLGEYEVTPPGPRFDRVLAQCSSLEECPVGQYRPCGNGSKGDCTACMECPAGELRVGCGSLSEGTCEPCPGCSHGFVRVHCGEHDAPMSEGQCEKCGTCSGGEFRQGCVHLAAGECKECQDCGEERFLEGCGADQPGVCRDCQKCASEGEFERQACTALTGRVCLECASLPACPKGQWRGGCSLMSEGTCTDCGGCPVGSYRAGCTGVERGTCHTCESNCPAGQFKKDCGGTEEGNCEFCPACKDPSQYRSGCHGQTEGECVSCTVCGPAEFQSMPCSTLEDGQCSDCSEMRACEPGSFRKACGHGAEGECAACESCPEGEYRVGCMGLSEGSCTACDDTCSKGQYLTGCGGTSKGECVDCEVCPAGTVTQGCEGRHRGACVECSSIPCPPHHERVMCGGTSLGMCVRSWVPDTPPPMMIRWSLHRSPGSGNDGCIDWGQDNVPHVNREFHAPHSYLRLAACNGGEIEGTFEFPIRGNWAVQFYVGVPVRATTLQRPTTGSFPKETEGEVDPADAMTVTINGEAQLFQNSAQLDDHGRLWYLARFDEVKTLQWRFNFTSSSTIDHAHMLVSPGEASYLGDFIPKEGAQARLLGERASFSGQIMNAVDGQLLTAGAAVGVGDQESMLLKVGEADLAMFVGSTDVVDVVVTKGEFHQSVQGGRYACQARYPGFYTYFEPDCHVGVPGGLYRPVPLSPFLNPGNARFILTWLQKPPDMEIRLDVPLKGYSWPGCTVRYTNTHCKGSSKEGRVVANLEYNSRAVTGDHTLTGYGPETIMVSGFVPGDYYVRVKHFLGPGEAPVDQHTNVDAGLQKSGAVVTVYLGSIGSARFKLGKHGYTSGVDWLVAKIDGLTQKITECTSKDVCPLPTKWD